MRRSVKFQVGRIKITDEEEVETDLTGLAETLARRSEKLKERTRLNEMTKTKMVLNGND